jgi:HTH-type transcriptional regulator/antitoxin HigA
MKRKEENEYHPNVVTPPGKTLQETLDALDITKAGLAERIGMTPKTVGEIVNHGAPITPTTAMQLEKALGVPASFWNNRERRYREYIARQEERKSLEAAVEWLKSFPVREMINAGWLQGSTNKAEQLAELLRFFGVASRKQWRKLWLSQHAVYRKSPAFAGSPEASSAWLRRGELAARDIECGDYDREEFRSALNTIRSLTRTAPADFQDRAEAICAEAGVALVFVPPIKGVSIFGATRWLTPRKALIQLCLRCKWEDILWFTFFHEAYHILHHGKRAIFIEQRNTQDQRESDADEFAQDFLIPTDRFQNFIDSGNYASPTAVTALARQLDISPAVVVGRLQHDEYLERNQMNRLRRRFDFVRVTN